MVCRGGYRLFLQKALQMHHNPYRTSNARPYIPQEIFMKKPEELFRTWPLGIRVVVLYVLMIIGVSLLVLGYCGFKSMYFFGLAELALMFLYHAQAFRCSHCGAVLGRYMIRYSHCPKCGKRLIK